MPILYNCHTDGDQYRITKFDSIGEPQSSYLCTEEECECPAGVRQTCRHRQMLRLFLQKNAVNTHWLYSYEHKAWVLDEPVSPEPAIEIEVEITEIALTIPPEIDSPKIFFEPTKAKIRRRV